MKEIRATSLMLILMVAMGMTAFPAHAQVDFDIFCFLGCVATCVSAPTPKLLCISTCITTCYKPAPLPPKPLPPASSPSAPPKPPKLAPPHMVAFPPQASLGMKSCNFLCSVQECGAINTDIEKLKCLENCSKVACEE